MSDKRDREPGGEAQMGDLSDPQGARSADTQARMRTGWIVIALLAGLTGLEFWLSTAVSSALIYLVFTAIAKAALIIYFFMHIAQVWRPEGSDH